MSTEPHTTFENKKIVYSDTILPLKDIGNNLRIKTIEKIEQNDIIKTIVRTIGGKL